MLHQDWNSARQARNRLNVDIKNIKANFIQENLEQNQGDSKQFWKDIQIILPKKISNNSGNGVIKNELNEPIYVAKVAADFINDYFVNVGPKLAQCFVDNWEFNGTGTDEILNDFNVIEDEVISLCKEINVNKSSAIESLSSTILKLAFLTLSKQFTFIINLIFRNSKIPKDWKIANVTPLFKSGDASMCNNYRPISPLPLQVEKIVHN